MIIDWDTNTFDYGRYYTGLNHAFVWNVPGAYIPPDAADDLARNFPFVGGNPGSLMIRR